MLVREILCCRGISFTILNKKFEFSSWENSRGKYRSFFFFLVLYYAFLNDFHINLNYVDDSKLCGVQG